MEFGSSKICWIPGLFLEKFWTEPNDMSVWVFIPEKLLLVTYDDFIHLECSYEFKKISKLKFWLIFFHSVKWNESAWFEPAYIHMAEYLPHCWWPKPREEVFERNDSWNNYSDRVLGNCGEFYVHPSLSGDWNWKLLVCIISSGCTFQCDLYVDGWIHFAEHNCRDFQKVPKDLRQQ